MREPGIRSRYVTFFLSSRFAKVFIGALTIGLCIFVLNFVDYRPAYASTFTVTLTTDTLPSGVAGELRWAINSANGSAGPHTISFAIPGSGVHTIALSSELPGLTQPVTIDGTTQPGASCGPAFKLLIEITKGLGFGNTGRAFIFNTGSEGSAIKGLVINNMPYDGISLFNGGNNRVTCSFIGTDPTGTLPRPNGTTSGYGIVIGSITGLTQNTVIGGTTPAERNIISGNIWQGVAIIGNAVGVNNNVVEGNYIGTDVTGTLALPNALDGVGIFPGGLGSVASGNVIGGTVPGAGNVISGNSSAGISISGAGAKNNVVEGNYIGVNAVGSTALGNGAAGVIVWSGAAFTTIGGTTPAARNIISGNGIGSGGGDGIDIFSNNNIIQGNYVGVDVTGTVALPNTGHGATAAGGGIVIASSGGSLGAFNTVGGTTPGAGNILSGNGGDGIDIGLANADNNVVEGNYIGTDVTGTKALGNFYMGVGIFNGASNNVIGGTTPAARNIISGNQGGGINYPGVGIGSNSVNPVTTNNLVEGNYVGVDVTGMVALGNGGAGIALDTRVASNTIGGTTPGAGNVISSNAGSGVLIIGTGATNNVVVGNYIGANASGNVALGNNYVKPNAGGGAASGNNPIRPNAGGGAASNNNSIRPNAGQSAALGNQDGVGIFLGASSNTIGGTVPGAGNLIVGNGQNGIRIGDTGTSNNVIQGNFIGTNASGLSLPNAQNGILIDVGASANSIGGPASGAGNVIAFNNGTGVLISSSGGNPVRGNSVYSNGALGIHNTLTGPPSPVFTSTGVSAGKYQISGTLTGGTPNTPYALDFYTNAVGDPSGIGQGQTYLGSATVTTNNAGNGSLSAITISAGNASFGLVTFPIVAGQAVLSATATSNGGAGDTSDFSTNATVVLPILPGPSASSSVVNGNGGPSVTCVTFTLTTPQQIVLTGEQATITITLINNCTQALTNVQIIVQIGPPFTILSPNPNCRQATFTVGTLQVGQQFAANVITSVGSVTQAAALTTSAVGDGQPQMAQLVAYRPSGQAIRALPALLTQTVVNVAEVNWDDQNVQTASQILYAMPGGTLPSTGEHPNDSAPAALPGLLGIGVLLLFGTTLIFRRLRNHAQ